MKKHIGIYFLLVVFIMALAGCSKEDNVDYPAYFKTVEEVNTFDALVAANGSFRSVSHNYYSDGSTVEYIIYGDKDQHFVSDEYGILVIGDGESYGYSFEEGFYKNLFPGNFDKYYQAYNALWNLEGEKGVSKKEKKGLIYLETASEEAGNVEFFADAFGYDKSEVTELKCTYVINPKDNEIEEYQLYLMVKGEKKLCSDMKLERGVDRQSPDQRIVDGLSATDTWTQTVITDGGTANEKAYTQTAPKGSRIYVYMGYDFELERYSDASFTTEIPDPTYMEDNTYYLKRITQ